MPADTDTLAAPATPLAQMPSIALGGNVNTDLTEGVLALRVEEDVEGMYGCEITFGNWGPVAGGVDFLYFDRKLLDFGTAIEIRIGSSTLFSGAITALEGEFPEGAPPVLNVLAEDALQAFRMTRRTRTFSDVDDQTVFKDVAGDHNLSTDVQAPGPTYRVLTQLAQSDLAFLRERARAIDAELWISNNTLMVRPRSTRSTATARIGYGRELRSMTIGADLAGQRSDVTVSGWDVAAKEAIAATADDGILGNELGSDDSGASILASAFSARHEHVAHAVPLTSEEARARSEALFKQAARRFVRGRCSVQTSPDLQVGTHITVDGLGDLFTGEYYVTHVVHEFNRRTGLQTELTLERPGLGSPS